MTPQALIGEGSLTPAALIQDLRASCQEFLRALDGLSDEDVLRRPAPSEWSAWEVCYHVATSEMWLVAKLCEVIHRDKPAAAQRLMGVWAKLREEVIALAAEVPAERWDQPELLTGVPDWTPAKLLARRSGHDREHARQTLEARGLLAPTDG